jgi:regulator of nucleoside diphosphate kinase
MPPITLTRLDSERLERLARASMTRVPRTAAYLAHELDRANVVEHSDGNCDFVRMGSLVTYRDDGTGQVRRITLVYPEQADVSAGKISVLTPVGAALIGLSPDQSIEWLSPIGERRSLTVLAIEET